MLLEDTQIRLALHLCTGFRLVINSTSNVPIGKTRRKRKKQVYSKEFSVISPIKAQGINTPKILVLILESIAELSGLLIEACPWKVTMFCYYIVIIITI
jgi:hypothetical protein